MLKSTNTVVMKLTGLFKGARNLITAICFLFAYGLNAQDGLTEFLNAGEADANKLTNAYLEPIFEGLSYGFNGGWLTSAKTHKKFGFDIGITFTGVFIPDSKNYFTPNDLGLETTTLIDPPSGFSPTIVGPGDATTYEVTPPNGSPYQFAGPEGLDFEGTFKISGVLTPMVQFGIGTVKNTDLKIRFMPKVSAGGTEVKMWGLGLMHDFKQWIPGLKMTPIDMSVLVAYTNFSGVSDMSGIFDSGGDPSSQELAYSMSALLIQAQVSKKLSVFTFYGGVGYNLVATETKMKGSYEIPELGVTYTDPISLDYKNDGFRLNVGMRILLGVFYLYGDYTLQEYNTVTAGFGFSVK